MLSKRNLLCKILGLGERVAQLENDTQPRTVVDSGSGFMIPMEFAVAVPFFNKDDWRHQDDSVVFFKKGTQPDCDFIEQVDGELKYFKKVPETRVEVQFNGAPLKAKKKK